MSFIDSLIMFEVQELHVPSAPIEDVRITVKCTVPNPLDPDKPISASTPLAVKL
jgi:hypothetical protein